MNILHVCISYQHSQDEQFIHHICEEAFDEFLQMSQYLWNTKALPSLYANIFSMVYCVFILDITSSIFENVFEHHSFARVIRVADRIYNRRGNCSVPNSGEIMKGLRRNCTL